MRVRSRIAGLSIALFLFVAAPASAQVVQSLNFGVGLFAPAGFDRRASGDVLVENLITFEPLAFEIKDFRGGNFFGEWNLAFGDHVEFGVGAAFYSRSVPSVYLQVVNRLPNGQEVEIAQDLKLRIVPIAGVVRFLAGRPGSIQPYIGGGVAALNWRYSEIGDFVDTSDYSVFFDRFIADGTSAGGVFLAGVRFPIGGDIYGITTEYRHTWGSGRTGGFDAGFLADKIDLSGSQFNFGVLIRF